MKIAHCGARLRHRSLTPRDPKPANGKTLTARMPSASTVKTRVSHSYRHRPHGDRPIPTILASVNKASNAFAALSVHKTPIPGLSSASRARPADGHSSPQLRAFPSPVGDARVPSPNLTVPYKVDVVSLIEHVEDLSGRMRRNHRISRDSEEDRQRILAVLVIIDHE